jgi:8-oxo-dGTP pyrophosphatase MutT (NUDIX family)
MSDYEHGQALRKTGFWGKQGAGAIILAKSTGKFLIPFRSSYVEQPNTWGVWGGAIDSGEDPKEAAKREVQEEAGYRGGDILMIPLYIFHDQKSGFKYYNFLAVVDDEFTPNLNWETENFKWVEFGQWPTPLHFGLKALLQHSGAAIQKVIEKVRGSETVNESDGEPKIILRENSGEIKKGDFVKIDDDYGPYGGNQGKVIDFVKMIRGSQGMRRQRMSVMPQVVLRISGVEDAIQVPLSKVTKFDWNIGW